MFVDVGKSASDVNSVGKGETEKQREERKVSQLGRAFLRSC